MKRYDVYPEPAYFAYTVRDLKTDKKYNVWVDQSCSCGYQGKNKECVHMTRVKNYDKRRYLK